MSSAGSSSIKIINLVLSAMFLTYSLSLVQVYFRQTDAGGAVQDEAVSSGTELVLVQAMALSLGRFVQGLYKLVTSVNSNVRSSLWT